MIYAQNTIAPACLPCGISEVEDRVGARFLASRLRRLTSAIAQKVGGGTVPCGFTAVIGRCVAACECLGAISECDGKQYHKEFRHTDHKPGSRWLAVHSGQSSGWDMHSGAKFNLRYGFGTIGWHVL